MCRYLETFIFLPPFSSHHQFCGGAKEAKQPKLSFSQKGSGERYTGKIENVSQAGKIFQRIERMCWWSVGLFGVGDFAPKEKKKILEAIHETRRGEVMMISWKFSSHFFGFNSCSVSNIFLMNIFRSSFPSHLASCASEKARCRLEAPDAMDCERDEDNNK